MGEVTGVGWVGPDLGGGDSTTSKGRDWGRVVGGGVGGRGSGPGHRWRVWVVEVA